MLGINPGELTAKNSKAYWTLFHFGDQRVQRMARHTGDLLEKWVIYLSNTSLCQFGTKHICVKSSAEENSGPLLIQVSRRHIKEDRTLVVVK